MMVRLPRRVRDLRLSIGDCTAPTAHVLQVTDRSVLAGVELDYAPGPIVDQKLRGRDRNEEHCPRACRTNDQPGAVKGHDHAQLSGRIANIRPNVKTQRMLRQFRVVNRSSARRFGPSQQHRRRRSDHPRARRNAHGKRSEDFGRKWKLPGARC